MPIQSSRYDALPPTGPGYLPPRAPVSRYSAAAKSRNTNIPMGAIPGHQDNNATTPEVSFLHGSAPDTYDPSLSAEDDLPSKPRLFTRRSMMQDYKKQIIWAFLLLLLPLPLSAVLMYLIYANLQPRDQFFGFPDTITVDNTNQSLSDQDYFVNYSATRLVFISSLSSTLALALIPVSMTLFAYLAAFKLQKASSTGKLNNLPSPFQFELTIRLLGGNTTDLYRYLKYILTHRRKRLAAVPMLNSTALMLALMLMLAICITVVDALLHIGTSTVQYHNTLLYPDTDFNPGRRLPTVCWNITELSPYGYSCNYNPGGSGAAPTFDNSTEAYLTLGNQSTRNIVRLADDGKTAIITPPAFPSTGVHFEAQSYASATTCETVTNRCKPHFNGEGGCDACQSWAYNCTPAAAGLRLSGNFSGSTGIGYGQSGFPIVTEFFNTSSKTGNLSASPVKGEVWFSVLFVLPAGTDEGLQGEDTATTEDGSMLYDPAKDLVADTYGNIYGIISCTTTLSEVTYSMGIDGSIYNTTTKPMNDTAALPFYDIWSQGFGDANIGSGINLAAASAESPEDLAYQVGRVFDRTILGLTAGALPDRQAVGIFQTGTKQVAKVPIAEFVALIVLNLVLPVVGFILGVWAWILCARHGVRDVQARLGIGALVAGLFENEKFNDTAAKVEDLFAETRGLSTARVAVESREKGAGQVFVAVADDGDGTVK